MGKNKTQYQGPRPLRQHLTIESQIEGFEPKSAQEALYAGSTRYVNKEGKVTKLRNIDNPKRQKTKNQLSHGNTETAESRKLNGQVGGKRLKGLQLRKEDYIKAFGVEAGTAAWETEKTNTNLLKSQQTPGFDIDHIQSVANGGVDGSRNKRLLESVINQSEGARTLSHLQRRALGLEGGPETYIKTNGPWATQEMNEKIVSGEIELPEPTNRTKAKKLYKELRYGSRIAGQSPHVYANFTGDLIGTVIDGASYFADREIENLVDLTLSSGQTLTSLTGSVFNFVGMENVGLAITLVGDRLATIEKLINISREGWSHKTRKVTGGTTEPWKIK